jgi:hypothetical protein
MPIGSTCLPILPPLPHGDDCLGEHYPSISISGVNAGPSPVDTPAVPDVNSRLFRRDTTSCKVRGNLGSLTVTQPDPLDHLGLITVETVEAGFSPTDVECFGLFDLPPEVATVRVIEVVWPSRDYYVVEQCLQNPRSPSGGLWPCPR